MNTTQIRQFHSTKSGYLLFTLIEALLSYLFGSLAINSGSLWQYALSLIFLIGSLQNLWRLLRMFIHAHD